MIISAMKKCWKCIEEVRCEEYDEGWQSLMKSKSRIQLASNQGLQTGKYEIFCRITTFNQNVQPSKLPLSVILPLGSMNNGIQTMPFLSVVWWFRDMLSSCRNPLMLDIVKFFGQQNLWFEHGLCGDLVSY